MEARLRARHLRAAWGTPIRGEAPHGDENDVAVAVAARGAWARFWVRGARYLRGGVGVAGFYLDGIAPPPVRGRGVPSRGRPPDMHAANKTAVYLELYPYLDSVWTGEAQLPAGRCQSLSRGNRRAAMGPAEVAAPRGRLKEGALALLPRCSSA